ncbi:hypothetical protein [Pedococcus sp. 5OH_020]|uniref:hypothetical protein n=1 Tax=Pedococcus sp. 5OH_020 TaxID=2989814 RepID=UPI0022E9D528|nr:hypothetical protein [Pedococcus sp. 5OH_020]
MSEFRFGEGAEELIALTRAIFDLEVAEMGMPHIVLTRSPDTGAVSYSGPYDSGLDAMEAAERERQADLEAGGQGEVTFEVAALYSPLPPVHAHRTALELPRGS